MVFSQNQINDLVLNNMKKLNEITLWSTGDGRFGSKLLQNSRETLKSLHLSEMYYIKCISEDTFPKLSKLNFSSDELPEFQKYFPKVLKNIEFLEQVQIMTTGRDSRVCRHVCQKYEKHCLIATNHAVQFGG